MELFMIAIGFMIGGIVTFLVAWTCFKREKNCMKERYDRNLQALENFMRVSIDQALEAFSEDPIDNIDGAKRRRGPIVVIDCDAKE